MNSRHTQRMKPIPEMARSTSVSNDLIMASVTRFFSDATALSKAVAIIEGRSHVSLRIIDWFVTNYSRRIPVTLCNPDRFNVHQNYRAVLKGFSKHNFDPFRRRNRISFNINSEDSVTTTIGQLNFFKWLLENNVLAYIEQHLADIEADMHNFSNAPRYDSTMTADASDKSTRRQTIAINFHRDIGPSTITFE